MKCPPVITINICYHHFHVGYCKYHDYYSNDLAIIFTVSGSISIITTIIVYNRRM